MSSVAVITMVIALVVVWGGLVAAIVNIRVRPAVDDALLPAEPDDLVTDDKIREHDAPLHRDT